MTHDMPTAVRYGARWMLRADMPAVLDIERAGAEPPWTQDDFLAALRRQNCIGYVADDGRRVVGFMLYALQATGLRLLTLAVHPDARRRGVGRYLLGRLERKLHTHRRETARACVGEWNLGAQLLLRACGYAARGVVRGRYGDGRDGYEFELRADAATP